MDLPEFAEADQIEGNLAEHEPLASSIQAALASAQVNEAAIPKESEFSALSLPKRDATELSPFQLFNEFNFDLTPTSINHRKRLRKAESEISYFSFASSSSNILLESIM